MYHEIPPPRPISIGSVKINPSLVGSNERMTHTLYGFVDCNDEDEDNQCYADCTSVRYGGF